MPNYRSSRKGAGEAPILSRWLLAALVVTVGLIGGLNDGHILVDDDGTNPLGRTSVLLVGTIEGQVDAALTWTRARPVPGRSVETVAGEDSLANRKSERRSTVRAPLVDSPHNATLQATICADPWACFRQGYRDFGGRPEWEEPLVDVLRCESRGYGWADTYPLYISRAQFDPDSWATAVSATKLNDSANPYHVGANVAVWSTLIEHPGGSGGWAECWKQVVGLDGLNYSE